MIKSHLKADKADESEGVKTYGKRQTQHPQLASMYSSMQQDEKGHLNKLNQALRGLKGVKPKEKD